MKSSLRKVPKLDSLEVRLVLIRNDSSTSLMCNAGSDNDSKSSSSGDETPPSRLPPISQINNFDHSSDKKLILGEHAYGVWDSHLGLLTCSARWTDIRQVKDRFLNGGVRDGKLVVEAEGVVESVDLEIFVRAIWTFEKGRHIRRMEITTPGATLMRQLVYDSLRNGVE